MRLCRRRVRRVRRNALSHFRDRLAEVGPRLVELALLGEKLCVGVADQLENLGYSAVPGRRQRRGRRIRTGAGGKNDIERGPTRPAADSCLVRFKVAYDGTTLASLHSLVPP